jgi:hypothetical protein
LKKKNNNRNNNGMTTKRSKALKYVFTYDKGARAGRTGVKASMTTRATTTTGTTMAQQPRGAEL